MAKKKTKKAAPKMNPKMIIAGLLLALAGILGFGLMGGEDCNIKGNVTNNGKLYHTVGQPTYRQTDVNPENGDQWFCSEADAKAAGFKKAQR